MAETRSRLPQQIPGQASIFVCRRRHLELEVNCVLILSMPSVPVLTASDAVRSATPLCHWQRPTRANAAYHSESG